MKLTSILLFLSATVLLTVKADTQPTSTSPADLAPSAGTQFAPTTSQPSGW